MNLRNSSNRRTGMALIFMFCWSPLFAQGVHELKRTDKIEIFLQHLGKVARLEAPVYQSLLLEYELAQTLAELGSPHPDPLLGDFISRSLEKLHPEFAAALKSQAQGDLAAAQTALQSLEGKGDPYLAAYAGLNLAELERAQGRHREAMQRAGLLIQKERRYLLPDHRACELVALGYQAQEKPLLEFLQYAILMTDYKDVPEEVKERVGLRLAALQEKTGQPLRHVTGWMDAVEKWIQELKTGAEPTQKQQGEILAALDKLIELQEARERNT